MSAVMIENVFQLAVISPDTCQPLESALSLAESPDALEDVQAIILEAVRSVSEIACCGPLRAASAPPRINSTTTKTKNGELS